ncbi:hypothetical protein TPHA_0A03630 [Tetrapisispora phaffii CBS 4417]|uniref:Uncharacterized protein n=1 Tax=Tetrapisispora phaffii (strain ATCC 24235 / CBS 4417 / NBRC 1672 / NRRL Y-8282 / UCD 70-5) TaxID=1071381 RepID=G8BNG1_TETPH|nr:hypothetical protein TPHA_0A03630 [Tetrapisispora phaffii CBS 4417]CCE61439.1 hypothetical protein TPHA_0A03630 [Tetrapisispora phaffii CBS 4417]
MSGMVNQSMPMVAMFLRNKFVGWFALIQSFHYYLNSAEEDNEFTKLENRPKPETNPAEQTPAIRIALSLLSLLVCYMDIISPQPLPPTPVENDVEAEVKA